MELPTKLNDLKKIYNNLKPAISTDLEGEYYVNVIKGIFPDIKILNHKKNIIKDQEKTIGYNIFFDKLKWGYFELSQYNKEVSIIDYNQSVNTFISRYLVDYIKCIKQGELYLGKLYIKILGIHLFLIYFTLTKKHD